MTTKQIEKEVERAYYKSCSGIPIDIMDIGSVFRAGLIAFQSGFRGEDLEKAVRAFVETIRKN